MDVHGSPEYSLTWKAWDMPQREPICALRASARRISGSGCSGWPTADASVAQDGEAVETWMVRREKLKEKHKNGNGCGMPLTIAAQMAMLETLSGWPTTGAQDQKWRCSTPELAERRAKAGKQSSLESTACMSGWSTASSRDYKDTGDLESSRFRKDGTERNDTIPRQASGAITTSSPSATEKRGALNPGLSRWIMGYPVSWLSALAKVPHKRKPGITA